MIRPDKGFLIAIWIFISFVPMLIASLVYGWIIIPLLSERPKEGQSWDDFVTEHGSWLADQQVTISVIFYLILIIVLS